MDKNKFTQAFNKLTNRRKEVLLKLLAGERDMEIASSLHIAESTVRKHIQEICENFGLKNELGERYPKRKDLIELFLQYLPELVKKSDSINSQIQQQITSQNLKKQHQDWGEAPEVPHFCGRTEEIEILKHGIVTDKAKLVALLGMGGIGKTALVTKIAQEIQDKFDWLIWRSLREAPSIQNILADLIFFISQEQEIDLPDTVGGRITKLLEYLSYSRCLIILDNAESIFQAGTILASGSADQTIKLWNIETGESFTLPERDAFGDRSYRRVRVIAFSPDGKTLISGSDDQSVRLWDVNKSKSLKTIYGHTQRVWSVTFSLDDKTLISGSDDGKISIWNIQTGKCKILGNHAKRVQSVAYTPQGKKIASGGNDGWVKLWDITTGKSVSLSEKHGDWIWLVSFNYDGTKLVSAGDDHSIKLWDTNTNQCWKSLNDYPYWIWSVAISPDSENIVIGSDAHVLQLWNIATGKLTNIGEHQNRIRSVAWSPHGKIIASGSDDLTIKLWDISSGECLHILAGHNAQIRFLVFSPESKIVASASDDKIIRLWDVNTGQCLHKLQAHTKPVWSVAFSFDGKILASGSEDTTINLWDVQTGNCLQTLIPKKLYQDMNIAETQGLTEAQRDIIIGLGATNTYKN
jgi:WD40 repeat protein